MKTGAGRKWLLVLALLILLPVAALWLAESWLESTGGREVLERELTARLGMPVRLAGEFELSLFPAVGAFGTDLRVGGPGPEFIRSREYEISLALGPLLNGTLLIEQVRVSSSDIRPDRLYGVSTGGEMDAIHVDWLSVSGFGSNRTTAFELELAGMGAIRGNFLWNPVESLISFNPLNLATAGGDITGDGCLWLRAPLGLSLDLEADVLDLDAVRASLPRFAGGEGGGVPDGLAIRLNANALQTGGTIARGVEFRLGTPRDCQGG